MFNYWDLVEKINSSDYMFSPIVPNTCLDIKTDNLNIYNWTMRWKNSKINMLKLAKPRNPKKSVNNNYPMFLLSQVPKMIPTWIRVNPSLNLYVLKITIGTEHMCEIAYKDIEGEWIKSYRTIKYNEPVTIPYF